MGNAVFPEFPGLKWGRKKTAVWSTGTQKSASGREFRTAYYTYPQWRFSLSFEVLRTKASVTSWKNWRDSSTRAKAALKVSLRRPGRQRRNRPACRKHGAGRCALSACPFDGRIYRACVGGQGTARRQGRRHGVGVRARLHRYRQGRFGFQHAATAGPPDHMDGRLLFPREVYV